MFWVETVVVVCFDFNQIRKANNPNSQFLKIVCKLSLNGTRILLMAQGNIREINKVS